MDKRRNLSVEDEKQLKIDFAKLYYNETFFTYKQIAEKLQFGVAGTLYEKLSKRHLGYYYLRFHFTSRLKTEKLKLFKKKKKPKHKVLKNLPKWRKMNSFEVAKLWGEFNGSWSEFIEHVESV